MLIARERTGWGPSLSATAPKRPGTPRSCSPQASDVAWGFYPDDHNPHRVGYVTVTDGLSGHRYTYWVEPRWLDGYLRGIEGCCDASDGPPAPSPPHAPPRITMRCRLPTPLRAMTLPVPANATHRGHRAAAIADAKHHNTLLKPLPTI